MKLLDPRRIDTCPDQVQLFSSIASRVVSETSGNRQCVNMVTPDNLSRARATFHDVPRLLRVTLRLAK